MSRRQHTPHSSSSERFISAETPMEASGVGVNQGDATQQGSAEDKARSLRSLAAGLAELEEEYQRRFANLYIPPWPSKAPPTPAGDADGSAAPGREDEARAMASEPVSSGLDLLADDAPGQTADVDPAQSSVEHENSIGPNLEADQEAKHRVHSVPPIRIDVSDRAGWQAPDRSVTDDEASPPKVAEKDDEAVASADQKEAFDTRSEAKAEPRADTGGGAFEVRPPIDLRKSDGPAAGQRVLDSGGSGGGGKGNGGGGGGGGGGGRPIEQRSRESQFREALASGLSAIRGSLIVVGIFSFFVNILLLSIPLYLFQVSDRVLTSRSGDTLVMLTMIVIGALAIHTLLDMMRRFLLMRVATRLETRLGAPVLGTAAKVSSHGQNIEFQALQDLQQVRGFLTGSVLLTIFDAPVAPIYVLVVFMIHPHLGFILLGASIFLLVIALINQQLTAAHFARANQYNMRANHQADAMSRNTHVLNAMGMVPEAVMLWGRETAESLKSQVLGQDRNIIMSGLSKMARLSTQIGMLGWGAWLALDGELTGGMIIAASIIGSRALGPIEGTIEGWRSFVQARSAYGRIRSLLQSSPLRLERLRLPRPEGRLDVERVLYVPASTKKVILNGITFSLAPGESLAILGPSGSGKTTLARMLVGAVTPTAGNVRLDLMDLRNWDPRQFGESLGYLPQDVQLFPGTIKANIARMRDNASDGDVFDAAELADVHGMISEFAQGYETYVHIDGSPLSGGQKQRLGLARAFYGNPKLLVLDEPNANLDAAGERALALGMLRAKERGITVVAITQRTSMLQNVDKIMLLESGTVQAFGSRDKMLKLLASRKNGKAPPDSSAGQQDLPPPEGPTS